MQTLKIPEGRRHDLACLGRLAVDLYAQQIGSRLEDATSFSRYLGGSSANIAFGAARLGLRAAMVSRVGDEQMGRFLVEALQREGCDVSQIQVDPQRLTALVLLGIKDRDTFPCSSIARTAPTWRWTPHRSTAISSRNAAPC
jgi:5-dehydro-2-deoxygluconokinase